MFRSAVTVVFRPMAQFARCLYLARTSGLTAQRAEAPIRMQCRHLRLSSYNSTPSARTIAVSSYNSTPSSFKESIVDVDERSESVTIKQYLSTLSAKEQEQYTTGELQKLSPRDEKRLRVLEMEYDVWMSTGVRVPDEMTQTMWFELLHTHSRSGRLRSYNFWFKRQCANRNEVHKKALRQEKHLQRKAENRIRLEEKAREMGLPDGKIPFKNAIHMFVRQSTMLKDEYNNLAWAMQFGQPLIMDLAFESHMKNRERTSLIKQLFESYGINKSHPEPFNLVMCGLTEGGLIDRKIKDNLNIDELPITMTSENYLDLYPREQLVYLTPDSPNDLLTWSPHDIYIIGALVDLGASKPLTLAKAKRQNLRTARLPLDRFMLWQHGGKCLTLDHMMKVLCDVKEDGDWRNAFRHISTRKGIIRPQGREPSQKPYKKTNIYRPQRRF